MRTRTITASRFTARPIPRRTLLSAGSLNDVGIAVTSATLTDGSGDLEADWARGHQHTEFARELAHLLEQEAQLEHYRSLTVFACSPFLGELLDEFGKATWARLAAAHDADLTGFTLSEIEERIAHEIAANH